MTTQTTQSTKVVRFSDNTTETWDVNELAEYVGMDVNDLKNLKATIIGQLVSTERRARNAENKASKSTGTREKQSMLFKFRKKATGTLADSFRRYLREEWITQQVEKSKEQRDRTDQNMDSYGEKVLAVLFEMGLLESEFEQLIRDTLNSKD